MDLGFSVESRIFLIASLLLAAPLPATAADGPAAPEPVPVASTLGVRPSDSPLLRPPASLADSVPASPSKTPGPPGKDPTATITHVLATGESFVKATPAPDGLPSASAARKSEPFPGLAPPVASFGEVTGKSILGSDDRTRVTITGTFPWRTIVRLDITWVSGARSACSGAVVSDYHVLTAGHCVYDYGGEGWANAVQVFPGLDDDYMPYNYAWATYLHSYTGWTQSGLTQHDWALIALDRSVGTFTGWMGRQTDASSSNIYTGTLNAAGYPGTPSGDATCPTWANCLYTDSDSGHSATEYNHWYWMDTSGGQSGGPVWRYLSASEERFILTAHTCGTGGCGVSGSGVNHGTRLNQDKFDRILTWIGDDADIAPDDRADLIDDGPAYSGFTPSVVTAGNSFTAFSDVRNVGTASSGGFSVSYYASTNTIITSGDHLLGTAFTSSTSPFTWNDSDLVVSFPNGIPDGTYNVGWIIDPSGTVDEFDENNNTARANSLLTVCNQADAPVQTSPSNGAQLSDRTPTFAWSSVSGADSYRLQVDDDGDFGSPVINLSVQANSYTPTSDLAYGTYYWRIRADKPCGAQGHFSPSRSLTIVSGPIGSCTLVLISATTLGGVETHGACSDLWGGPSLTVSGSGDVTLEAGKTVVLFDGFRVESGGGLTVKTCGHSLCEIGPPFDAACHTCAQAVCAADPWCCDTHWDNFCVDQVASVCGLTC